MIFDIFRLLLYFPSLTFFWGYRNDEELQLTKIQYLGLRPSPQIRTRDVLAAAARLCAHLALGVPGQVDERGCAWE